MTAQGDYSKQKGMISLVECYRGLVVKILGGVYMTKVMIGQPVAVDQIYADVSGVGKLFGISRRTMTGYVQEMYRDPAFVGGDDYLDLSPNKKLIKIEAFKRFLGGKHMKWRK